MSIKYGSTRLERMSGLCLATMVDEDIPASPRIGVIRFIDGDRRCPVGLTLALAHRCVGIELLPYGRWWGLVGRAA